MPLNEPPPPPNSWWRTIPGQLALVAMLFGGIIILLGSCSIIGPRA